MPTVLHFVHSQLIHHFSRGQRVRQVLFVREHEQRAGLYVCEDGPVLVEDVVVQLVPRLVYTLAVGAVDDEYNGLSSPVGPALPQRANLRVAAEIAQSEVCVLVSDRFDVVADCVPREVIRFCKGGECKYQDGLVGKCSKSWRPRSWYKIAIRVSHQ